MTENEARSIFWQVGAVAPWYLRPSQLDIYELLVRERRPFIEAARRFGKTTSILCFVIEKLLQNPGWICRWCFPNKNQAREVLMAEVAKIQQWAPEHLKFKYQTTDSVYIGPNGSKLYLRGVNEDRGDSARGPAANIIIADEYGFWVEPDYIIRECLSPQLQNQEGRWLIKASTPPRNLGHLYYTEREEAHRRSRFIQKIIYDNEALSQEELQEIIDECGGVDTPSFRRERLCEPVSDPDMLVIPEYSEDLVDVPDDYPRPDYFDIYVAGDSGADDNTFIIFAYYDFLKDEVVCDDEYMVRGKTTREIIDAAKDKERVLWPGRKPHRRVYDADKQLLIDIMTEYQYPMLYPRKDDKIAAIHELRVRIARGKFKVKKRCVNLRRQLKVGMWKDERHSDFERTEGLGHLDGVASAIYLNRSIDTTHNPWPRNLGLSHFTHFIPAETPSSTGSESALKSVFGGRRSF